MPRTAERQLPAGSMLAHYKIEAPIGQGAMGVVYRAHDEGLDRTVAVKVLRPAVSGMTVRVDRFFREARAAARVSHPNLTHIYFVGGDGSYRFFAMEYVTGCSLDEYVEAHGSPDLETGIDFICQAAAGLAAAHDAGIVHRDVKPSNVLVREDGSVKVTDFGLSKSLDADVNISQEDSVIGTPTYMSPEQCRSKAVDARADIYCLGLTAWALFTGRPPYPGPSLGDVLHDQINTPLPSLLAERPDLPEGLDRVLRTMCSKKPSDRPSDMVEVVRLLEACRPRAVLPAPIVARAVAVGMDFLSAAVALGAVAFAMNRASGRSLGEDLEFVIFSVLFLGFTVVAEVRHGMTLGKWFLNLRVRARDGSEPHRKALWLRGLLRFPGAFLWACALPILFGWVGTIAHLVGIGATVAGVVCFYAAKGRTLSDLLTNTRVTYDMPPDERRRA